MLAHDLHEIFTRFRDAAIFDATRLKDECLLEGLGDFFARARAPPRTPTIFGAKKVFTVTGSFSSGDLLLFRDGGALRVGKAHFFARLVPRAGPIHFACLVDVYAQTAPAIFRTREARPTFVQLSAVEGHCSYQVLAEELIRIDEPIV